MHTLSIENKIDGSFWLKSEWKGFPSLANWGFWPEKNKTEWFFELIKGVILSSAFQGFFNYAFNIISWYFFSSFVKDCSWELDELVDEITLAQKDISFYAM